jgi:hypothetical protein
MPGTQPGRRPSRSIESIESPGIWGRQRDPGPQTAPVTRPAGPSGPQLLTRQHVRHGVSRPHCRARRSALALDKPDDLGFLGLVVPDEQITPFSQLGVDELIQRDGAVDEVRLGQAGPVLKVLQILCSLRYQGNSDPVSKRLPGNVAPGDVATCTSRHDVVPPFQRCQCGRCRCCEAPSHHQSLQSLPAQAPVRCRSATGVVCSSGSVVRLLLSRSRYVTSPVVCKLYVECLVLCQVRHVRSMSRSHRKDTLTAPMNAAAGHLQVGSGTPGPARPVSSWYRDGPADVARCSAPAGPLRGARRPAGSRRDAGRLLQPVTVLAGCAGAAIAGPGKELHDVGAHIVQFLTEHVDPAGCGMGWRPL